MPVAAHEMKFSTVLPRHPKGWVAPALLLLVASTTFSDAMQWRFDGQRYLQLVDVTTDGEYWSNYEPIPPADYEWFQFMTFSQDS
eukprot:SAG31_NODE_11592_length_1015_cov_1.058952_1_plen_84_part_10